jgi:Ca2+-binding EF-hand superfamily protein
MRGMRMYDMFKMLDRDNDNYVTHDEIMAGLKRTGLPMTNDEIRRLISLLDENDDGAISYKEFLKIRKTKVFNDFHARNKKVKTTDAVLKRKISYLKK